MRTVDKIIRYGGDEFLIILPESKEELESIKERLIQKLKNQKVKETMAGIPLSLSIGVALKTIL